MDKIEAVVIGAGVVGLAVARALALAGREVVILEAEDAIGTHTSSRNSEVIHAGIYYPKGSLKASSCVEGRRRLYEYCAARGVPHRRCGKLIVAGDDGQLEELRRIRDRAHGNGVTDVDYLPRRQVLAMEPELSCVAALYSPATGIVDSHALMLAYQGDAENSGAAVVLKSPVTSGAVGPAGIVLNVGGDEPMTIACTSVVNCAGLFAQNVARSIEGIPAASIPPQYFAKAHYYTLSGKPPFGRLVYPVASNVHLGVHVTVDMAGQIRFGPDVSWVDSVDYSFDHARGPLFYEAIRKYYPRLKDGQLQPGYTGIRPKVSGPKEPAADFIIRGPEDLGIAGLVSLFGIESPGLTASLAIAQHVRKLLAT